MEKIETEDALAFMQGQMAALELVLRMLISESPAPRARFAAVAGRLAGDLAQDAPREFANGWYHTLRSVNGGPFPVVGELKD